MALNSIDNAFSIVNGLSFDDDVGIFHGSQDPTVTVIGDIVDLPIGSLYVRTNGQLFQKTGSGDNDWTLFETGGPSGDPVCIRIPFFQANGIQNNIPLTILNQIPFFQSDGTQNDISLSPC